MILFYYSGHGYNDPASTSRFPTMALDGRDYALEDVYNLLRRKQARLTLTIGDLCNSIPRTRAGTAVREALPFKSSYFFDYDKLYRLFIDSEGDLISTSSRKGEWSYCTTNPDGTLGNGYFTDSFIKSLIKETSKVSNETGNWITLFNRAYQNAKQSTANNTNQNGERGQSGFSGGSVTYD